MKQQIYFNEVVTRDGFQMEAEFVPTDTEVELINALSRCGYAKIEVTSFTSAKAIPMLRDAEEVMGRIQRAPSVEYTVLVPNVRGAERAMEVKPDEFNLVMSTSETHNLSNLRMPRENSFAALKEVIRQFGHQVPVNVSLSACFGCPMEGDVSQQEVLQWSQRFADLGVRGLTICDTTGMAQPNQVAQMCEVLQQRFPSLQLTLHFHNTRGMGLANVLAAVQSGIGLWLVVLAILFAAVSIYYYFKLIQAMYFVEGEPAIQEMGQVYKYKLLVFAILILGLGILPNVFLSYLYF